MMRLRNIACAAVVALAGSISMTAQESASSTLAAGNYQVSVLFGNNTMFNQNYNAYLLPKFDYTGAKSIGLGEAATTGTTLEKRVSDDPGAYLNIGEIGSNSVLNMIGVQGQYFLTSEIDVNAMFAMNIAGTPKRDYEDGYKYPGVAGSGLSSDYVVKPTYRYIEGRLTSSWMANVGGNYHFTFSNPKLSAYGGVRLGAQMGRVQTVRPYTGLVGDVSAGDDVHEDYEVVYTSDTRLGQVWGIQASIVGGLEYEFTTGFVFGIEVAPVAYQYSVIEVGPQGYDKFFASNHNVKIFATPNLKLGFRF